MEQADAHYDAIVIGSGAAGSTVTNSLTAAGVRTLLLEAGPQLDAEKDFATPRQGMRFGGWLDRAIALVTGQPVQARSTNFKRYTRHLYVNDRAHPYSVTPRKPFKWIRGRQLGGRLHLWGRMAPRMSDYELKAASIDGHGRDWPVTAADLAPYYDRVESAMGLYGSTDNLEFLPDGRVDTNYPLNSAEILFGERVNNRWAGHRPIEARVLGDAPQPVPILLADAVATGHVTVETNSIVQRIMTDTMTGLATGVEVIDRVSHQTRRVYCSKLFVCASAFESVRLLLNSAGGRHPRGIGNSHDLLGRGIMDHLFFNCGGYIPSNFLADIPEPSGIPSVKYQHPFDFNGQGFYLPRFDHRYTSPNTRTRGCAFQGAIGRDGPWWWLGGFGETVPRTSNRLLIDQRRRDTWGIPVLRIEYDLCQADRELFNVMKRSALELLNESGLANGQRWLNPVAVFGQISARQRGMLQPGLAVHECGGAPLGIDPAQSVLDPYCRIWDAPNVVVCDAAAFPSCGYQNPALTIMAMAMRAAEYCP